MMKQLSQRSLLSERGDKKRVFFDQTPIVHSYPSVQSFLPDEDLWYTQEDCRNMILAQLEEVMATAKRDEAETRGLESICTPQRVHKRGATKRYVITIVHKDHANREAASKLLPRKSKRAFRKRMDSLKRYSAQVTAPDKEFAYRMAFEDEIQARTIYLEDGMVKSTVHFAAKSAKSVKAKAARAVAMPPFTRSSFTAKSA